MFEKVTKYFANKATGNAVEGVKDTLNDKINRYGDIIQIGLVLSVIILGGRHIAKQPKRRREYSNAYLPEGCSGNGMAPVVINNYYHGYNQDAYKSREEIQRYHGNNYIKRTQQKTPQPSRTYYPKR